MWEKCHVREAAYVQDLSGLVERIVEKWGIDAEGHLAPPSKGGFGVITETGRRIDMWHVKAYFREEAGA